MRSNYHNRAPETTESLLKKARIGFGSDDRTTDLSNEEILIHTLGIDRNDLQSQPHILQNQVNEMKSSQVPMKSGEDNFSVKCKVRDCTHNLCFSSAEALINHHNDKHPTNKWTSKKMGEFKVVHCGKCNKMFHIGNVPHCVHLTKSAGCENIIDRMSDLYNSTSWSITVAAIKTDVPTVILQRFEAFLDKVKSIIGIACLERGDKENNLHLQAAAEISWNPEDSKGLAKILREVLQLDLFDGITFKVQCKCFEAGQNWLAMLGYCQKWRENREFRMVHRGISDADLEKGQVFLQVYRSDYTKDKYVLDMNNILKASYAHWTATRKPVFVTFCDNMHDMLRSGNV